MPNSLYHFKQALICQPKHHIKYGYPLHPDQCQTVFSDFNSIKQIRAALRAALSIFQLIQISNLGSAQGQIYLPSESSVFHLEGLGTGYVLEGKPYQQGSYAC